MTWNSLSSMNQIIGKILLKKIGEIHRKWAKWISAFLSFFNFFIKMNSIKINTVRKPEKELLSSLCNGSNIHVRSLPIVWAFSNQSLVRSSERPRNLLLPTKNVQEDQRYFKGLNIHENLSTPTANVPNGSALDLILWHREDYFWNLSKSSISSRLFFLTKH